VEVDGDDLLIEELRIEEGDLLGALADVIPSAIIERALRRRGAEKLGDRFLAGHSRPDRRKLVLLGEIPPLIDDRSAGDEGAGEAEAADQGPEAQLCHGHGGNSKTVKTARPRRGD